METSWIDRRTYYQTDTQGDKTKSMSSERAQSDVNDFMVELSHKAGDILMRYFGGKLTHHVKTGPHDFATEADHAAEAFVLEAIQKHFPDDAVLGEETGFHGSQHAEYTWIVDPLDGTKNFASGSEDFGVMIARVKQRRVESAIIYSPIPQIELRAHRGEGTYRNNERVQLADTVSLDTSRVMISPKAMVQEVPIDLYSFMKEAKQRGIQQESWHSAARNTIALIQGEADAYMASSYFPWDYAPPALLCEEAGMRVTDLYDAPITVQEEGTSFLFAVPQLHTELLTLVRPYLHTV